LCKALKRLLIIETIPNRNDVFEGNALKQSLEAMKKSWDGRITKFLNIDVKKAFTKKAFLSLLEEETDYLHISAHGKRKRGHKHILVIGNNRKITPEDIRKHKPKAKCVFVSACYTGFYDVAAAFFDFDRNKKGFYLAPKSDPAFDEAFLLALQFHRGAFLEEYAYGLKRGNEKLSKKTRSYIQELKSVKRTYQLFVFPQDLKKE
jgi:hypothetical protein